MLAIRIKSNNSSLEGNLNLRQLNQLLDSLIDPKVKEVRMGKWTERKSELVSVDVFEIGDSAYSYTYQKEHQKEIEEENA